MVYTTDIYFGGFMDKAQIFMNGRSQAVRLPKEYRFKDSEVTIQHFAGGVLLLPKKNLFDSITAALDFLEPDFQIEREQPNQQMREEIKP
jgi:antitoxin VapB